MLFIHAIMDPIMTLVKKIALNFINTVKIKHSKAVIV
jgi:hypothetical protein